MSEIICSLICFLSLLIIFYIGTIFFFVHYYNTVFVAWFSILLMLFWTFILLGYTITGIIYFVVEFKKQAKKNEVAKYVATYDEETETPLVDPKYTTPEIVIINSQTDYHSNPYFLYK